MVLWHQGSLSDRDTPSVVYTRAKQIAAFQNLLTRQAEVPVPQCPSDACVNIQLFHFTPQDRCLSVCLSVCSANTGWSCLFSFVLSKYSDVPLLPVSCHWILPVPKLTLLSSWERLTPEHPKLASRAEGVEAALFGLCISLSCSRWEKEKASFSTELGLWQEGKLETGKSDWQ